MPISVRVCEPNEIGSRREAYREKMHCQIIHESIHARSGWTVEYVLEMNGTAAGYGSVAIGGPWTTSHALYEFYIKENCCQHIFDRFAALLAKCSANMIETQTNAPNPSDHAAHVYSECSRIGNPVRRSIRNKACA